MPSCLIKNKFVKFILRDNCDCVENVFCKYCCVINNLVNNIGNLLLAILYVCVVYLFLSIPARKIKLINIHL